MKFLPILSLNVTHGYYSDGVCPDFSIAPAPVTDRILRNHRCVLKSMRNGIRLLIAVDNEQAPSIPILKGTTFTFTLRLQNPEFALFTDLTDLTANPTPLYTNAGADNQLSLTSRTSRHTDGFRITEPAQKDSYTLSRKPLDGISAADFEATGLESIIQVDAYDAAAKIITVNSQRANKNDILRIGYPVKPNWQTGVFAEVDIHVGDALASVIQGPREFEIAFRAKQARWEYYFVTNLADADKGVQIIDADTSRSDAPLVFNHDNPAGSLTSMLSKQYPAMQRFRFVSEKPIACRQEARRNIQLHLNGSRLLTNLPNPALHNFSRMEVEADGNLRQQESLFQVVKYITHSFSTTAT